MTVQMHRPCWKLLFVAVVADWSLAEAIADESASSGLTVEEVVRRVDEQRYYPQEHGLRDAKIEVELRGSGGAAGEASGKATVFWRLPAQSKVDILQYESPTGWEYPKGILGRAATFIAPLRMAELASGGKATCTLEADGTKLHIEHPPDSEIGREVLQRTIWYDANYLEKRVEILRPNGLITYLSDARIRKIDGQLLYLGSSSVHRWPNGGERRGRLSYEYEQVEGIWLIRRLYLLMDGWEIDLSYTGHRINQGLPDSLFSATPQGYSER